MAEVESDEGVAQLAAQATLADRPIRFGSSLPRTWTDWRRARTAAGRFERRHLRHGKLVDRMARIAICSLAARAGRRRTGMERITPAIRFTRGKIAVDLGRRDRSRRAARGRNPGPRAVSVKTNCRVKSRALVIIPGTHSKHLSIDDGRVNDFQTFMTGELFERARPAIASCDIQCATNPSGSALNGRAGLGISSRSRASCRKSPVGSLVPRPHPAIAGSPPDRHEPGLVSAAYSLAANWPT